MSGLGGMSLEAAEAYRAGFAEAQRRAVGVARLIGQLDRADPREDLGQVSARQTARNIADVVGEMQPEGPAA